jgi:NADH dehydrogenase FAD-containing subunit
MQFDVLIIGGGVAGVSCALVLGSALPKAYAQGKKVGIFTHQKTSALQDALFNNAYGIPAGTLGADLMHTSLEQLNTQYPAVIQLPGEKVMSVVRQDDGFKVTTNKNSYDAKTVVVAVGSANTFFIEGLMDYVIPHGKAIPEKNRIQLRNTDHLVDDNLYVAGTLAGWRSQLTIAAGSGASVATDILTAWNHGTQSQSHDSIRPKH